MFEETFRMIIELPYEKIAKWMVSPTFTLGWCVFTVAYALKWLVKLFWESAYIRLHLRYTSKLLQNFKTPEELANHLSDINQRIFKLSRIRQPWVEFNQNLISEAVSSDPTTGAKNLKSPKEAPYFFNEQTILTPYIDARFYDSLPNQLSGMGVLGTFCGLSCGIFLARHGFTHGDLNALQTGITDFLGGSSHAFWTSIMGLFTSLIFSRTERAIFHQMRRRVDLFCSLVQKKFPLLSQEKIACNQLSHASEQNQQLALILEEMHKIQAEGIKFSEKLIYGIIREFRTSLTDAAGLEIKYIASAFKQIHHALQSTQLAIADASKNLVESSGVAAKQFEESFLNLTSKLQYDFIETIQWFQSSLKESGDGLSKSCKESGSELSKEMQETITKLCDAKTALSAVQRDGLEKWQKIMDSQSHWTENSMASQNQLQTLLPYLQNNLERLGKISEVTQHTFEKYAKLSEGMHDSPFEDNKLLSIQKKGADSKGIFPQLASIFPHNSESMQHLNSGLEKLTTAVESFQKREKA